MRNRELHTIFAVALVVWLVAGSSLTATATDEEIKNLRIEMEELRRSYESRIAAMELRLVALESSTEETAKADELAALRRAAAAETSASAVTTIPSGSVGRQNDLNRYNPEISVTGVILGSLIEGDSGSIEASEFELDLQSALDPFSKMRLTVAFAEGEAEIEEGFVRYDGLGRGLSVTVGRFRQGFGVVNRHHLHALPQVEYPLALTGFFGEEGLAQTGLSATWLMPELWADANELTVELTTGDNETFSGADLDDPAVLAHLKNYWELGAATWFELGLTAIVGSTDIGDSEVFGADMTLHWQPPSKSKYRELTWRTELLRSERENADRSYTEAWGGYSYVEGLVARNLSLGILYDHAANPLDPELETWRVAPYLSWWQSEYLRLRFEGRYTSRADRPDDHLETLLQLTFAAGPHKHESY